MPKVSVVIPTCNRPYLIKRTLDSVLKQSFQDFEIIVVDDGIKESAEEAVKSYNDARIKYIKHEVNKGGGAARNTGIKNAIGEYIAFLDDDDEWALEKLEKQVKAFETCENKVAVVFCGVRILYDEGKIEKIVLPNESGIVNPFNRILHKCYIWTSAMMAKRSCLEEEKFDVAFTKNQEWDLQLRLAKKYNFYAINDHLVTLNVQGEGEHMGGLKNIDNIIRGFERLVEKHKTDYEKQPKSLALRYFQIARLYLKADNFLKVKKNLLRAFLSDPFSLVYLKHLIISRFGEKVYKNLSKED